MRLSQSGLKAALTAAVVLLGVGIHWLDPEFFPRLFTLSLRGDIAGTIEYLRSFGVKAAWISFFLLVVINVLGFLPNIFLLVANGFLFGLVPGILISWAGECVGSALGFLMMRRLFQDSARAMLLRSGYEKKLRRSAAATALVLFWQGVLFLLCRREC